MLQEYNSSNFGSREPREAIDARTVYFHLKQQGRVVLQSFDLDAAKGAPDARRPSLRYRLSDVKSRHGLDSTEAYSTWRQAWWTEHIREQAEVKISSVARGKQARAKAATTNGGQEGGYMC